jgi:hypothetical protein
MSSFKKLNKADVTTVDYAANKRWSLDYPCFVNSDSYINIYKGTYITGTFYPETPSIDPVTNNQYERLVYNSINHLFYQSYTDVLNTGSIMFDINTYESASQQRPTASYFDYNSNSLLIKQFPTESGASIRVLVIDQNIYGSKVLPNSFNLSSSAYIIRDDGYGNLYDVAALEDDYINLSYLTLAYANGYYDDLTPGIGAVLVGNIFYAHGIVVITNPDYQDMLPLSPIAVEDSATFNDNDPNKNIYVLRNDIARTGTIDVTSIVLSGSNVPYYTVDPSGYITLNTTVAGNYDIYYTVNSKFNNNNCTLTSNKAKVTVTVLPTSPTGCSNYIFYGGDKEVVPNTGTTFKYTNCGKGGASLTLLPGTFSKNICVEDTAASTLTAQPSIPANAGGGYWIKGTACAGAGGGGGTGNSGIVCNNVTFTQSAGSRYTAQWDDCNGFTYRETFINNTRIQQTHDLGCIRTNTFQIQGTNLSGTSYTLNIDPNPCSIPCYRYTFDVVGTFFVQYRDCDNVYYQSTYTTGTGQIPIPDCIAYGTLAWSDLSPDKSGTFSFNLIGPCVATNNEP